MSPSAGPPGPPGWAPAAPGGESLLRLRAAAAPYLPIRPLEPDGYARGHAAFEARSNQRRLLTHWLLERTFCQLGDGPLSVLSVGCGDGSVDCRLADALTARLPDRDVSYLGLEPHAASRVAFQRRLAGLRRPGLTVHATASGWDEAALPGRYDLVLFVHSLYYVADVAVALQHARDVLAPGGQIIVLHAPQVGLNLLATTLAPPLAGHVQWWAESTAAALTGSGLQVVHDRISGALDLSVCLDPTSAEGRVVLDFTVQGRLPDGLRPAVLDVLRALRRPGSALAVEHPVDGWVLREP